MATLPMARKLWQLALSLSPGPGLQFQGEKGKLVLLKEKIFFSSGEWPPWVKHCSLISPPVLFTILHRTPLFGLYVFYFNLFSHVRNTIESVEIRPAENKPIRLP